MTPELEKRVQEALDAGRDLTEDEALSAELSASAEREANELATVDGWLRDLASFAPNDDELASLRNRLSTFDSVLPDVPDVTAPPIFEEDIGEGMRAAMSAPVLAAPMSARSAVRSAPAAQSAPAAVAVAAQREPVSAGRSWIPIALAAACVGLFVGAGTMFMAKSSAPMAAMEQDVSVAVESSSGTSALSPTTTEPSVVAAPSAAPSAAEPSAAAPSAVEPAAAAPAPPVEVPSSESDTADALREEATAEAIEPSTPAREPRRQVALRWDEESSGASMSAMSASMASPSMSSSSTSVGLEPRRRARRRAAPPRAEETPRARPSDADVRDVIRRVAPGIRGCTSAAVQVRVHVLGASGRIDETEIRTTLNATQAACVRRVIRERARFPEFSSDSWTELRFPGR